MVVHEGLFYKDGYVAFISKVYLQEIVEKKM
jgi:hypothetical protein